MPNLRRNHGYVNKKSGFKHKDNNAMAKMTSQGVDSIKKNPSSYEKVNKKMDEEEYDHENSNTDNHKLNYENEVGNEVEVVGNVVFTKDQTMKLLQDYENHEDEGDYSENDFDNDHISNEESNYEEKLDKDYEDENISEGYLIEDFDDKKLNKKIIKDQRLKDAPKMLFDMLSPSGTETSHDLDGKKYDKKIKKKQKHGYEAKLHHNVLLSSDITNEQPFPPTITKSYITGTTTVSPLITTNSSTSCINEIESVVFKYLWLFIFGSVFIIFISCIIGALCSFCGCCGDFFKKRKNAKKLKKNRTRTLLY